MDSTISDPKRHTGKERQALDSTISDPKRHTGKERRALDSTISDPKRHTGKERRALDSTISDPKRPTRNERLLKLTGVFLGAVLMGACSVREVEVAGNFPPPILEPLPVTLGVWYEPEFQGHEFFDEAKGRSESSWVVKTGEAQVQMWSGLLNGMFLNLTPMNGKPAPEQMNPAVDAVLIPRVDELQYAIPAHTNVKVYEIWMRYAFELVTVSGEPIAEWTMTAYGKTPTAFLQSDEAAVNLAAVVALRDAGAHFVTSFQKVPEVAQWLEDLESGRTEAASL